MTSKITELTQELDSMVLVSSLQLRVYQNSMNPAQKLSKLSAQKIPVIPNGPQKLFLAIYNFW